MYKIHKFGKIRIRNEEIIFILNNNNNNNIKIILSFILNIHYIGVYRISYIYICCSE